MSNHEPPTAAPGGSGGGPGRGTVLVAGAILLLAAIIVGIFVWTGSSEDDGAEVDAEQACAIVDRLPDEVDEDDFGRDSPMVWRLSAVAGLAEAAMVQDDDNTDLREAARRVTDATARQDLATLNEALDDLRSECDDLG